MFLLNGQNYQKQNLNFISQKKVIYSMAIISFVFIFRILMFLFRNIKTVSKYNKSFNLEKEF